MAPTETVYEIDEERGSRMMNICRWGLVPGKSRGPGYGPNPINARAESLEKKLMFKHLFEQSRCLVPADGFYEWKRDNSGKKIPYFIYAADGEPLAFAGLVDEWRSSSGDVIRSCTIVTTRSNAEVSRLHDRMPVIVEADNWREWLDPTNRDVGELKGLLTPAPDGYLVLRRAHPMVNRVENKGREVLDTGSGPVAESLF